MIQVREGAELLLKQSGIQITRDGDILPYDTHLSEDEEEEDVSEVKKKKDVICKLEY